MRRRRTGAPPTGAFQRYCEELLQRCGPTHCTTVWTRGTSRTAAGTARSTAPGTYRGFWTLLPRPVPTQHTSPDHSMALPSFGGLAAGEFGPECRILDEMKRLLHENLLSVKIWSVQGGSPRLCVILSDLLRPLSVAASRVPPVPSACSASSQAAIGSTTMVCACKLSTRHSLRLSQPPPVLTEILGISGNPGISGDSGVRSLRSDWHCPEDACCSTCITLRSRAGVSVLYLCTVMYRSEAGGCCDCGDETAWKPSGYGPTHHPHNCRSLLTACTHSAFAQAHFKNRSA